jgi:thiosulfate/3-mercaptopyruvate sulfurtransferase
MQKLGLNNNDIIIIYDNSPLLSSARCWFLLRYFGHKEIFILSGGIKSWKKNGFKTTNDISDITHGNFKATEKNKNLLMKIEEMINISDDKSLPILDARSFERFSGSGKEPRPNLESGHIPNSLNLPASKLLDKNGNLISKSEFKNLINHLNLNENEKVITTCGSGVSACVIALSYYRIGNKDIPVYDGSWSEWASKNMKINKL